MSSRKRDDTQQNPLKPTVGGFLVGFFSTNSTLVLFMETAQIVVSLKNQFFGASVLYAKDLAVVLGKSEKAVSNLISRNSLPFKVKILGGRRCVNIYEVA